MVQSFTVAARVEGELAPLLGCAGEALWLADEVGSLLAFNHAFAALVEEQLSPRGPELIIGALVDPDFGPAVMVGAGGILTELYRDVSFRLAPCDAEEARDMLGELAVAPLFAGFRGIALDADALARVIVAAGQLAVELGPSFSQLDINPIVSVGNGFVALDAKLVLATPG